jgi:sterol 3beta-glucosyltransferase
LRAPGKVVYLGFGSMMDTHPARLNAVVEEALTRVGCRAVLLAGPPGQLDLPSSPRRFTVREIPLEWLFRRVDAIVHHGGAGTTAQAARAGKPSVVVPFLGDQFFWGQRIHRAGGGPRPIPRRALTSARLVSALEQALDDPRCAERAASLGTQVRAEAGLSTAVRMIEERCLG